MKNFKMIIKRNAYLGFSAILFLALAAFFWILNRPQKEEYRIVCLGDSIIGNVRDNTSITAILEEKLGTAVYNGGFGGTTAAALNVEKRSAVTIDCISLVELADGICYENFSVPNAGINSWGTVGYFSETVFGFNRVDFDKVEVLVIEQGVNDYLAGVPLDNEEDPYDIYTFGGSLRYTLRELKEYRPNIRVLLCTPTYMWHVVREGSCEELDWGGGYLEDYANLELEIAREFDVDVLDNYHESGIGGEFENWPEYTEDGLHLNEDGRRLIAQRITEAINAME